MARHREQCDETIPFGLKDASLPTLCVHFRPHANLLTQTREFVSSFCGTFIRDPDVVYRLSIAAHELLENAIKYSSDGATHMSVEVRSNERTSTISIRAENRATRERIVAVRDTIDSIRGAADPFALYCEMIRSSVERNENSGLGLARIYVEADCALDYDVVDDAIAVSARISIDPENRP
ncbi:MAG TPA: ATP-binding protein [Polyangiaceae bacterium]